MEGDTDCVEVGAAALGKLIDALEGDTDWLGGSRSGAGQADRRTRRRHALRGSRSGAGQAGQLKLLLEEDYFFILQS